MDSPVQFPETVMLIDAALLNFVVSDFKKNFESMLQRPLEDMKIPQFVVNLALDAHIPAGNKEAQVIFVYDDSSAVLKHCTPSKLDKELNGVAFRDGMGEFIFASLSAEEMVTREDLYFDLLHIICESAEVKRIIVVPFDRHNQEMIRVTLNEVKNKEVTLFSMYKPEKEIRFSWQMLAYPVMQALGIKGEEIK